MIFNAEFVAENGADYGVLRECGAQRRLVIFVGAGVSSVPPTALPSWWEVNRAVVDALAAEVAPLAGVAAARKLACGVIARQETGLLPPEYQAEIIANREPQKYFDVLRCLDGDVPNLVHRQIAALVTAGRVAAIVTTNFDRLLEIACRDAGADVQTCVSAADFAALAGVLDGDELADGPCRILKIHGCVSDPATLIDTLAQRKIGFAAGTAAVLKFYLHHAHWLMLGYSGADLAAEPNYFFLRSEATTARGFSWLVRPSDSPVPAVMETAAMYGKRAAIVRGELPGWLAPLVPDVEPLSEPDEKPDAVANRVRNHIAKWAAELGDIACGMILADLLAAAGKAREALKLAETLAASIPAEMRATREFGTVCNLLSALQHMQGDYAAAETSTAAELAVWAALGDDAGRARALNGLGQIAEARADYESAMQHYGAALAIKTALGDARGRAFSLVGIGTIHRRRGDFRAAMNVFSEVLQIKIRIGDEAGRGMALNNLAGIHQQFGDYDRAIDCFRAALAVFDRLGDELSRAIALDGLAIVYRRRGEFDAAIAMGEESLRIKNMLGNERGRAAVLLGMAATWRQKGDLDAALHTAREALAIFARLGNRFGESHVQNLLAGIFQAMGDGDAAMKHFKKAHALKLEIGDACGRAIAVAGMAAIHRQRGEIVRAVGMTHDALKLREALGDRQGAAEALFNLGEIWLDDLDLPATAKPYLDAALKMLLPMRAKLIERVCATVARCEAELAARTAVGNQPAMP